MSGFERSFLATALLLALAAPASGEPLLLLHTTGSSVPATTQPAVRQDVRIGLSEKGDMVIQHGTLALIVACLSPETLNESLEQLRAQKQESPAIGGISFKFQLMF